MPPCGAAGVATLDGPDRGAGRWRSLGNALAGALYIGAGLGPGPRDGLMTGLVARGVGSIRLVRTTIELTVLGIGWLLGGVVGVGTVIYALSIGPLLHLLLPRLEVHSPSTPEGADDDGLPTVQKWRTSRGGELPPANRCDTTHRCGQNDGTGGSDFDEPGKRMTSREVSIAMARTSQDDLIGHRRALFGGSGIARGAARRGRPTGANNS